MVRVMDETGGYFHEPPYTEAEEAALYRGMSLKPGATILHSPTSPLARRKAPPRSQSPQRPLEEQ